MIEITQEWLFTETKVFLSKGENVIMQGRGNSMNPYLWPGRDAVVLSPYRSEDLKAGTIVLFFHHNQYILHRIIGRNDDCFVIQGDAIHKKKELVREKDIIAVAHTVIRHNGREVSTQSFNARLYWFCWRLLRPVGLFVLKVLRKVF